MDSTRQNKFARLIQKEISELFQREGSSYYGKAFVTVMVVKCSPDLAYVKVYLSVMGIPDRNVAVTALNSHQREIRMKLGMSIKNQIRHIPELSFFLDDSFDYVEKMEKVFKTIETPDKPTEQA